MTELHHKALVLRFEQLKKEYEQLLDKMGISSDEIEELIQADQANNPEMWDALQSEENKWDESLKQQLDQVPSPLKTSRRIRERGSVQPHWIFVR